MNTIREEKCLVQYIPHIAIGVVYNPEHERYGNYVPTILPKRYNAFVYIDASTALHSVHIKPAGSQIPETYPFDM